MAHPTKPSELAWLLDVTDSRQPLSETSPIWVRCGLVHTGPPTLHPERHPYCELSLILEGHGTVFVESEEADRGMGELLLLGPGVPHWGKISKYPLRSITVYFLPSVMIEMGPEADGVRILRRFTAKQSLAQRLVRLPPDRRDHVNRLFSEIVTEFEGRRFGREIKLRTILMEILVILLRWEQDQGFNIGGEELEVDWRHILKTLQYLRDHYTETVYGKDVARAVGISESRLKVLFQQALGISWVKYLQGYRIHRAAALLHESGYNVTEAALMVGFESLSHFNATFRAFMGVSPKHYAQFDGTKQSRKRAS